MDRNGFVLSTRKGTGILTMEGQKSLLNQLITWDEHTERALKDERSRTRWFNEFEKDMKALRDHIHIAMGVEWAEEQKRIVEFLTSKEWKDTEGKELVDVFTEMQEEKNVRARCALLQCPFGDMDRVVAAVVRSVQREDRHIHTVHFQEDESVSTIVDSIVKTSGKCLFVIKHASSTTSDCRLSSLFSLLSSYPPLLSHCSSLRILFCSPLSLLSSDLFPLLSSAASLCSFSYLRPEHAFHLLLSTLLDPVHLQPILLDGQFLAFLRQTFFSVDYSVDRLIGFINFAILDKYLKQPSWRVQSEEFKCRLTRYNSVLQIFFKLFHGRADLQKLFKFSSIAELNEHIQVADDFWNEANQSEYYEAWQYSIKSSSQKNDNLIELVRSLGEATGSREAEGLASELEEAIAEAKEETNKMEQSNQSSAPSQARRSILQLQQANRARMQSRMGSTKTPRIEEGREKCIAFVELAFSSHLHRHPPEMTVGSGVAEQLRCNLCMETENKLGKMSMKNPHYLAAAWVSLLEQPEWKVVSLSNWFAAFKEKMPDRDKQLANKFYTSLFLFEQMGLVRPGSDTRSAAEPSAMRIYHPFLGSFST